MRNRVASGVERARPRCRTDQREMSKIDADVGELAPVPFPMTISREKSSIAEYVHFQISRFSRWISSMKSTSWSCNVVRMEASSPGRPMAGPLVTLNLRSQLIGDDLRHGGLAESDNLTPYLRSEQTHSANLSGIMLYSLLLGSQTCVSLDYKGAICVFRHLGNNVFKLIRTE